MSLRFLFGPEPRPEQRLPRALREGRAAAFTADQLVRSRSWEELLASAAPGFGPDLLVLDLAYSIPPAWVWSAPLPVAAMAGDAPLLWHGYRRLAAADALLADAPSVERFRRQGLTQARVANLYGVEQVFLDESDCVVERDIDILFIGNLNPCAQIERLPWLQRLARLQPRWNVKIYTDCWRADYRALLRRARIVFNRSARSEFNRRVGETLTAGALALIERDNAEVPGMLRDKIECVFYDDTDLESRLEHYLSHEDERIAIARAGHARAAEFSFENQFGRALAQIESEWPALQERARSRPIPDETTDLLVRTWRAASAHLGMDASLISDLRRAIEAQPKSANLVNALGVVVALARRESGRVGGASAREAAPLFRDACALDPRHLVASLNLIEALCGVGENNLAAEAARRTLLTLDRESVSVPSWLDAPRFPPAFDLFQVQWQKAGWDHPADPTGKARAKRTLLRWRLHAILAELTQALAHFHEAVNARPDLPGTRAALGCALGRGQKVMLAVPHLRAAVEGNPFDAEAVRGLHLALTETGDPEGVEQLARDQGLLALAAPGVVGVLPWFVRPVEAGTLNLRRLSRQEFIGEYGETDTGRALCGFTLAGDTHAVLTLLAHAKPARILEIGTAEGHMTANLTEWSPEDATVFTMGITREIEGACKPEQDYEAPPREVLGRHAAHFGKGDKVFQITADSLRYDFKRLAPLDFVFIDGAHDRDHVLADTRNVYAILKEGGIIVWHDFGSSTPWVEVRQALEEAHLPEPIQHVEGTQVAFLKKSSVTGPLASVNGPSTPAADSQPRANAQVQLTVIWQGGIAGMHSLALVNREICSRLLKNDLELSLIPTEFHPALGVPEVPLSRELLTRFRKPLARGADVHVTHHWPPPLRPPAAGCWVVMQPWEFGSVPRLWAEAWTQHADEVWAPTKYVRDCYVEGGVPAERVAVVPLGVDTARFHPGAKPLPLGTRKRFKFLFVGGTIWRKGIDLLLAAYGSAFTDTDDVCLVIKDMGNGSFYLGQTTEEGIAAFRARPHAPEVEYLTRPLSGEELAGLYTACDALVHPYRGEGFGLPIAEAMACALPVIVTGMGAALDFCDDTNAFLIPARRVEMAERKVGDLETVGTPWHAEPDVESLVAMMRQVVAEPSEARTRGGAARTHVVEHLTWDHTAAVVEARLRELCRKPILRFQRRAAAFVPQAHHHPHFSANGSGRRMRITLTMIVRNEEHNLRDCLASIIDLVDEVILVDTGSTDRTKEIAASFGPKVKVFDFPWVDHFAAARNEALKHATGDFVLWLDADDRLDEGNRQKLRELFGKLRDENVAFVFKCFCPPDALGRFPTAVDHVRLFRNRPDVRWRYRVHEQILGSLRETGATVHWAEVVVLHTGYHEPAVVARKRQRDLRLLELAMKDDSHDPFTLFNLGMTLQDLGRHEEALTHLHESLARSNPSDSIVRKLYSMIAASLDRLGKRPEALTEFKEGLRLYPDDAELLFRQGELLRQLGNLQGAEASFLQLLATKPAPHFASVDPSLRGWRGRHELAAVLLVQQRHREAQAHWRQVVSEYSACFPAWMGLADVALAIHDGAELEEVARQVEKRFEGGALQANLLRGRLLLGEGNTGAAQGLAARLVKDHPNELGPRVILARALGQSNQEREAEQAWREVLVREPCHEEAMAHLSALMRSRAKNESAYFEAQGELTGWVLGERYQAACTNPSELNGHLPQLHDLARGCKHVTDLGTGRGLAATAFLWAQPEKLICYDLVYDIEVERLRALAGQTKLEFRREDDLQGEIEETDLLFVAPRPARQLGREGLARLAGRVRKYLVLQEGGEDNGNGAAEGPPPFLDLLDRGDFQLSQRLGNTLAVLGRVSAAGRASLEGVSR